MPRESFFSSESCSSEYHEYRKHHEHREYRVWPTTKNCFFFPNGSFKERKSCPVEKQTSAFFTSAINVTLICPDVTKIPAITQELNTTIHPCIVGSAGVFDFSVTKRCKVAFIEKPTSQSQTNANNIIQLIYHRQAKAFDPKTVSTTYSSSFNDSAVAHVLIVYIDSPKALTNALVDRNSSSYQYLIYTQKGGRLYSNSFPTSIPLRLEESRKQSVEEITSRLLHKVDEAATLELKKKIEQYMAQPIAQPVAFLQEDVPGEVTPTYS